MAKRRFDGKGQLPDWHLWLDVKRTVTPLKEWICTATAPRANLKPGRVNGPVTLSVYQP